MDYIWINYGLWINYGYNVNNILSMGDLQDPKMEVRKRTICLTIFCGDIPLHRPEK